MRHPSKRGQLTVPNHGNHEIATGLFYKLLKDSGLNWNNSNEKN
jgi:predicted RNA binding protein YcfA (HicA-like mRNA interferase family)